MENAMMVETGKWELVDYFDVWGNEQAGWEVNNQSVVFRGITITDDCDNDTIIDYLINNGFLLQTANTDDFYIMWDCDYIEIFEKRNGKPLYCFRKEYEVRKGENENA